jgi:RNA polymerase sigma-70 factor (ECF subfamily)
LDPGDDDDDRLAARSRHGDPTALAELYRRHGPRLLAYLERRLGNRPDAEDVLQETFLRIFAGRGRYDGRGRFHAWLFTIATRLAADRMRAGRRQAQLLRAHHDPSDSSAPAEAALGERARACIERVLADLPEDYAIAFHLRVREDFAYHDMSILCGAPEGTLRSRVHHTLRRIRDALAREADALFPARAPAPPANRAGEREGEDPT